MLELREKLDLAIEMSNEIIRLAEDEAWSDMQELDRQRMQVLELAFNDAELKSNPKNYEAIVQQIVGLNNRALRICSKARGVVSEKGRTLKLGREAIAAYHKQSFD
ncbi:MAG: hypothetical protein ABW104_18415 [Candidatus Thiodiazotropha sp. 6PLUC2]